MRGLTMRLGRVVMGVLYVAAGTLHFVATKSYERMIPGYLPDPHGLVVASGIAEIAGGVGVLVPRTRRVAAWGIVALLVAVMPANVWMAQHPELTPGLPSWVLWVRLPLQGVLVWWAWRYTKEDAM